MPSTPSFCFDHEDLFLIPIEALSERGIAADFAARILERGCVGSAWIELWNQAYQLYWQRARELSQRAGRFWLPPQIANICIATDPTRVRPFFQPLGRSSWLLDAADFEQGKTSLEFAVYQFFQVARMSYLRQVVPALVHNLGYWLTRRSEQIEDFRGGARLATHAHSGFRALSQALHWIPRLFHEALRPPPSELAGKLTPLPGTGLFVPPSLERELASLQRKWSEGAESRIQRYFAAHKDPANGALEVLLDWLGEAAPSLLITGAQNELLWDPKAPRELEPLRDELRGMTRNAAVSMRRDLEIVSERNQSFLSSLLRPEDLPAPGPTIDQNGLTYIHKERKIVAYNIHEPGMRRLSEPTPAFERWMLGARTIHEWGHLAVEAGWIPVPEALRSDFEDIQMELTALFATIVHEAPAAIRALAAAEIGRMSAAQGGLGRALLSIALERMSDWQANLLAQRYLPRVEAETYVRNNSRTLLQETAPTQLFQALAPYAFEYQYLSFSDVADPRRYFLSSTWFPEQFFARGVLSQARFDELLHANSRLCRCHQIDETRFHFPRL